MMHRMILLSLFFFVACAQRTQPPSGVDALVALSDDCGIVIPKDYVSVRKSADGVAYFAQGNPPGSISIEWADFSNKMLNYEAISKDYSRSKRVDGMVILFRSNTKGSRPIDEGILYSSKFAVLVTGKDASNIEHLVRTCVGLSKRE